MLVFFLFHFNQAQFKDDGICWDGKDIGAGGHFCVGFFLLHFSKAQFKDDGF